MRWGHLSHSLGVHKVSAFSVAASPLVGRGPQGMDLLSVMLCCRVTGPCLPGEGKQCKPISFIRSGSRCEGSGSQPSCPQNLLGTLDVCQCPSPSAEPDSVSFEGGSGSPAELPKHTGPPKALKEDRAQAVTFLPTFLGLILIVIRI